MIDQIGWKVLTVYQPWASLIALGFKTIETRNHAGFSWLKGSQLAIHAGKRYDDSAFEYLMVNGFADLRDVLKKDAVPLGAIVAVCRVDGTGSLRSWDEREACCQTQGLYGLHLADMHALIEPVPVSGKQGIWLWTPPDVWNIETHTRRVEVCEYCGQPL